MSGAALIAERVARESYGKLVAYLAARDRDLAAAQDALSEAFASALETWPKSGTPANPEGWLYVAARRRLADAARRRRHADAAAATLTLMQDAIEDPEADMGIPDRRLALMFACAHPAIDESVRAPLMLQSVLGLDAAAIGSAFLVSPAAMGQRLSRAKTKIRVAGVPFRVPDPEFWPERMDAVLQAIYAAFSRGWSESFSADGRGRGLTDEAIWLGRVALSLAPDDEEAAGLLALMLYSDARRAARRDPAGRYVPLADQDVALWNADAIQDAEAMLLRASARRRPGRFQLEAAIQSVHIARRVTGWTDWSAISLLYDGLIAMTRSPIVAINRAVAIAHAQGAAAGLAALAEAAESSTLDEVQAYWAARAELEARLGDTAAPQSYARAIGLETDPAVREFLLGRAEGLRSSRGFSVDGKRGRL